MKKAIGWAAASVAAMGAASAFAQSETQAAVVEATANPIWAAVFVALVLGLGVWFVVAMLRAENKRKAEQKSG